MPSTGLWDDTAALAVVPIAVWGLATGYGLLVERVAHIRFPNALLVPVGFCMSLVVSLGGYRTGASNDIVVPIVVGLAAVGLLLARRELGQRVRQGWPLLAAAATYLLFSGSVIGTGHWTLSGYNLENDSAYELVLISHLSSHGTGAASALPSTANSVVSSFLSTGYPLGTQSLLAATSGLLGVSAVVIWQGFISAMAAVGTMAAASLSRRTMDVRLAALAGFAAMAAALTYQYALQGSIKEIGLVATVFSSLAVMRWAIVSLPSTAGFAVVGIPLAAVLVVFNAAGLPYAGALAGSGLVGALLVHRHLPTRAWIGRALSAVPVWGICAIPALVTIVTFLHVVEAGYRAGSSSAAAPLGPLFRRLPLSEASGVWLFGDYRAPVPPGTRAVLTIASTVLIFALIGPGVLRMIAAREPGPLMGLVTTALVLLILYPRVVPYAQAKLLMIASPLVVLCAAQGLTVARGLGWRGPSAVAALGLGAAIIASDAIAYHAFPVAPTNRFLALRQVGRRIGPRGPVLDSEFEQFAKYLTQPSRLIDGPDTPTPAALTLLTPGVSQYAHSFDLNEEQLTFVESFPYVLTRRSPVSSRPPANFELMFKNRFYEVWERLSGPRVYFHLPLQGHTASERPPLCRQLRLAIAAAPHGSRLAMATLPTAYGFRLTDAAQLSRGWVLGPEGEYLTPIHGRAQSTIRVARSGDYEFWIQGNLPRRVSATLDGRPVGSAMGSNTPAAWLSAGVRGIVAGEHTLGVLRGEGGLGPGNGNTQAAIGAVAVSATHEPVGISTRPVTQWRAACRENADWVEVVE